MKKSSGFLRHLAIFGTAFIGLLLGHYLDYLVAIPDHDHRQVFLASTGHGYLRVGLIFACVALVISVLAALVLGYRRGKRGIRETSEFSFRSALFRLSVVQAGGFIALELVERLVSGGSFHGMPALLLLGVVVQVLVAAIGGAILVLLGRVAEMVAGIFAKKFGNKASAESVALDHEMVRSLSASPRSIRGPPTAPAFV